MSDPEKVKLPDDVSPYVVEALISASSFFEMLTMYDKDDGRGIGVGAKTMVARAMRWVADNLESRCTGEAATLGIKEEILAEFEQIRREKEKAKGENDVEMHQPEVPR